MRWKRTTAKVVIDINGTNYSEISAPQLPEYDQPKQRPTIHGDPVVRIIASDITGSDGLAGNLAGGHSSNRLKGIAGSEPSGSILQCGMAKWKCMMQ